MQMIVPHMNSLAQLMMLSWEKMQVFLLNGTKITI